ncbi:unnamed protein product [Rotaria sp. Silwood2]|nr:unnamed protein product [Rotaria sp. Silwood2]CAF3352202.1 unnamed protein product [Rotaria sp. Silwood2]CAF4137369.1 unnamed protein product [Rotaria sp. Silwood2]
MVDGAGSVEGAYEDSQGRIYSLNMINNRIQRWAHDFKGQVYDYALLQGGKEGVVLLGQLSTEIQVYTQMSVNAELIKRNGWNGSYQNIVTTSSSNSSTIVFIHSSYDAPQEVYFIDNIDQLNIAQAVTSENKLFTERNLPKGKSHRWSNPDDQMEIEGVLLYPPEQFEQKNLPLFVLIHGGLYEADLNIFRASWYRCAVMIATKGWLVLQPNYRGSPGYGDEFLRSIRFHILSKPGKDILYGVDALVRDGIADSTRLAIGGYSYGAYLTGWLITQTTRFNAALFGAGAIEHVADWGLTDIPLSSIYYFGGYPWQTSNLYQEEAAIFQLDKVRTPTHIVVPGNDIRVSSTENYILERALNEINVPTKLIVLPGEPHGLGNNPWHEKIKIREELKWLRQYGNFYMKLVKRQENDMVQNSIDNKKRKLQNEITTIDKYQLRFRFENLTDGILYEIFEYLDMYHIYKGFFNLNKRFNDLLNDSNFLIKINILPMSKSNFESYKKNIVTPNRQRINIFRLSNQFIAENIFSSPNIILRYINLEILILENIDAKYLDKIINYLIDLPKFYSLSLSIVDYIQTLDLFVQIFRLSRLKYCKIIYQRKIIQQSSSIKRNKYSRSPIQCLIINGDFPLSLLHNLLSCLPQLQHLLINSIVNSNYIEKEEFFHIQLKYLKKLSLRLYYIQFDKFEKIIKKFFRSIEILRLTTFFDEAYLNAKRWEELILSSMPNLRIFDIYHEGSIRNNDLTYHDIINQFNSSFWKDFTFYWKSAKQICSNISEMNFNSVKHLYVYGEYATQNDINYFPNVTQLTIQHYLKH